MAGILRIKKIERVREDGSTWDIQFQPGVNVLIGPQNTSKTTPFRILDFCLGDDDNANRKFARSIFREYQEFMVNLLIHGRERTPVRRLKRAGQLRSVEVEGILLDDVGFSEWIMGELEWPLIYIPRGIDPSVTEEHPLTFRALYRHIYRRSDSWNEFASREFEYYRRGVTPFYLGIAREMFGHRSVEVQRSRAERELTDIEQRQRNLRETLDDAVKEGTAGFASGEKFVAIVMTG